jgi:type IV secretory pathway VirD2 relaxase
MVTREDDQFQPRPSAPKARSGPRTQRFISQVLKASSRSGATGSGSRTASTFGRGRVAAVRAGQGLAPNARRAIIKARYVVLKSAGAKAVATHLRYIERDGTTRDGKRGQAYGADTDAADLQAFEQRGRSDRHQFRFIVSVEESPELEDLKEFTRQLMQRIQIDLETRLDWVAVDHWDTDNPHTHIVLRGRAADGQNLVIAPDYMAHGMRMRASELATEWLGPRTELEMRQSLQREVDQERLTSLDRTLIRQAKDLTVDLTSQPTGQQRQTILRARLQRLEAMSLAERIDANRWHLSPTMTSTLSSLGERGDILRTMHKALRGKQRECVLDPVPATSVIGRIVGKGLADELHDRAYIVIDGMDGRAHYLKLPTATDLTELPIGGILKTKAAGAVRAVDLNIVDQSAGGIYRTVDHFSHLQRIGDRDPQVAVDVHVRRLEALRRSDIVKRLTEGIWQVPDDLVKMALDHDSRLTSGQSFELKSYLSIEQQIKAFGATWLDRCLIRDASLSASIEFDNIRGFGAEVAQALKARLNLLVNEGLAMQSGQRIVLARDLLTTLRERDVNAAGDSLAGSTGKRFHRLQDGSNAHGIYNRSIQIASGKFALIENEKSFSLAPWRPIVETRLGQRLSVTIRGSSAEWRFSVQKGLAI